MAISMSSPLQSYEGDEGRGSWRLLLQEGNYNAAISRYREALDFKPHDAEATFKLAEVLNKTAIPPARPRITRPT